jgi:DNA-binding CsgD family transcriptional regulator
VSNYPTKWTPERHRRVVTLAAAGLTGAEIAVQLETTRSSVLGHCHRSGVKLPMTSDKAERARPPARTKTLKAKLGRHFAADHPVRRKRDLGARAFTVEEIATAIAAHMAGLSRNKAAKLIRASAQSLSSNWLKQPDLVAAGRDLFERAKGDAAALAAKRRELEDFQAETQRLTRERVNWPILGRMSERHRAMMERRIEGQTLQEIGDAFNVSRERVRQVEVCWRVEGLLIPGSRRLNMDAAQKLLGRLHVAKPVRHSPRFAPTIGGGWA